MRFFSPLALCLSLLLGLVGLTPSAHAEYKPDDSINYQLSAEEWVTTNTARVTALVQAAASGTNTGALRTDMQNAVNTLAKGEWRLVSFNRTQDQTGLERWTATYEARLPENLLGGLFDAAKRVSKAGMQLSISDMDFSPTLAEIEAVQQKLRLQLTKQAAEQLAQLNQTLPGRSYRLSNISFNAGNFMPMPMVKMERMMASSVSSDGASSSAPMQTSQKLMMQANVSLAAVAPTQP